MVRAEEESCSLSCLGASCDCGMLGISTGAHEYMATKLLPFGAPPGINTGNGGVSGQNSGARYPLLRGQMCPAACTGWAQNGQLGSAVATMIRARAANCLATPGYSHT